MRGTPRMTPIQIKNKMLSDSPRFSHYRTSKARPVNADTNRRWSDNQKVEAVTTYLMLGGNVRLTSSALQIHEQTLYTWKKMDWWNNLIKEIRQEEKLELSTKLKKIISKSWAVVEDRLENGDYVYNSKTGETTRKGVSLRDASKVAVDAALLRDKVGTSESFTTATEQIGDKLAKLADAFTKLSKGVVAIQHVEDIEYAVHDEREEGLQEGEPPLQLETLTTETPK